MKYLFEIPEGKYSIEIIKAHSNLFHGYPLIWRQGSHVGLYYSSSIKENSQHWQDCKLPQEIKKFMEKLVYLDIFL